VKTCPNCEAELKDSVISCVRCGQPVRGDGHSEPRPAGGPGPDPATSTTPPGAAALATKAPPSVWAPLPQPARSAPSTPDLTARRALPSRRSWGPDPLMLLAGLEAMGAGVLAFLAVKDPWVHLTVTRPLTDFDPGLVVTLTVRGKAAFVGTAGTALAATLAVMGVLWFFYGFQRGWTMPGILNPALGIIVVSTGLFATVLASMVWFVWQDAMILRAKAARISTDAMRELVHLEPAPLVQIGRLSGLMTFGGMMLVGLLASCLGWYAYRRRS